MTSPSSLSREFLRSQFGSVLQSLPAGHDKPLKQAFYSTAATLFVVLACCAAVAVYHILLPFIRPLLWALLCGTVLFPLKYRLVTASRRWLGGLRASGTPLVVGTVFLPVVMVDSAVTNAVAAIQCYIVPLAIVGVLLPAVYFLLFVLLGQACLDAVLGIFSFVDSIVGCFRAFWVSCIFVVAICFFSLFNVCYTYMCFNSLYTFYISRKAVKIKLISQLGNIFTAPPARLGRIYLV